MPENATSYHAIDVAKLLADRHDSVVIPLAPEIMDQQAVFALNATPDSYTWSRMTPGGAGVRVPLLKLTPSVPELLVINVMATYLAAGAALTIQSRGAAVQRWGIVFDPAETTPTRHFGVFAILQ
jgi:hypothetical protein